MIRLIFTFCVVMFGLSAHADCVKAILNQDFWSSDKPFMVNVDGQEFPITFSFDSEVPDSGFLHWAAKIPELKELADNTYANDLISIERIMSDQKMSEAQARAFVLKRGVPTDKREFAYTDFHSKYVSRFFHSSNASVYRYADFWNAFMKAQELPIRAHVDDPVVEFTHASYSDVPSEFKSLIAKFDSLFTKRSTHYHIGIPVRIGLPATLAIARAMETVLMIPYMEHWPDHKEWVTYYHGSTFSNNTAVYNERGFVRFQFEEWTRPHHASNFELRQWQSPHQAFSLLEMGARLAQNHERLHVIEPEHLTWDPDVNLGNPAGALSYAGRILRRSQDPADQQLGIELGDLAARVVRHRVLQPMRSASPEIRQEVADFLKRKRVRQRLTIDKFLK